MAVTPTITSKSNNNKEVDIKRADARSHSNVCKTLNHTRKFEQQQQLIIAVKEKRLRIRYKIIIYSILCKAFLDDRSANRGKREKERRPLENVECV